MFTLRGAGSASVGRALVRHLDTRGVDLQLWLPAQVPLSGLHPAERHDVHQVPQGTASKLIWENSLIPWRARSWGASALVSLGDTGSLVPGKLPHLLFVQQAYLAYSLDALAFSLPRSFSAKLSLMSLYFRHGIGRVAHFIVQTQHMKEALSERWKLSPSRISVLPLGVDIPGPSGTWRPSPKPYITYIATASPHKNHTILADVLAGLRDQWPDIRCKLTVDAEEVPALVARARELSCLGAFDFMGRVRKQGIVDLLRHASVSVIPSQLESLGLPYFESMAAGCPVVAADLPHAREACGHAALYAPARDAKAYVEAVASIIESGDVGPLLSERGMLRVRELQPEWAEAADGLLRLISGIRS